MANDIRITPRSESYSEWYTDVIKAAELVDQSAVRGSMVFRPYGYAIWELIQKELDARIKAGGHQNVYFPLLIPASTLAREAKHVAGFAMESAVVTHHRLKVEDGELIVDPDAKLTEPFVIRPTSEAIMYETFGQWITSWRDLPLLINQWANVMRWEMRTRPFLRTSEFLWQEGHTAHATKEQAVEEQKWALSMYKEVSEQVLALSPVAGEKSPSERFAGADSTMTLEGFMQDGKALQSCTSHMLGQNFSKAFNISFTNQNEQVQSVWQTSWGMSTRILGSVIMTHSDDKGLVLPPTIAPYHVVIIPIFKGDTTATVVESAKQLKADLENAGVRVHLDERDYLSFGERVFEWEKKGVPIRFELGPRDIEQHVVTCVIRDTDGKKTIVRNEVVETVKNELHNLHERLFSRSKKIREEGTRTVTTWDEFKSELSKGGFILGNWDGTEETEAAIKEETGATIRCIPFDNNEPDGVCVYSGKDAIAKVIFAKAY